MKTDKTLSGFIVSPNDKFTLRYLVKGLEIIAPFFLVRATEILLRNFRFPLSAIEFFCWLLLTFGVMCFFANLIRHLFKLQWRFLLSLIAATIFSTITLVSMPNLFLPYFYYKAKSTLLAQDGQIRFFPWDEQGNIENGGYSEDIAYDETDNFLLNWKTDSEYCRWGSKLKGHFYWAYSSFQPCAFTKDK